MAFYELTGQALRDFDAQRAAGLAPKPKGLLATNTERPAVSYGTPPQQPKKYGLMTAPAPAIAPGFGGVSNDVTPKFGGDGKAYAPGYGPQQAPLHATEAARMKSAAMGADFNNSMIQGHVGLGPARPGMSLAEQASGRGLMAAQASAGASYFPGNPGAAQAYDQLVKTPPPGVPAEAWAQVVREQVGAQAKTQAAPVTEKYRAPDKSAVTTSPTVDWAGQRQTELGLMNSRNNEWRANASRSMAVNAAKRGLMAGGNSGAAEEMQRDVEREYLSRSIDGAADLDTRLFGQMMGHNLQRAGQEDSYNLGLQNAAMGLARQPHELMAMDLQNRFAAMTLPDRARSIAAQYRIDEAKAQEAAWIAQNQGWLAAAQFIAGVAGGAGAFLGGR